MEPRLTLITLGVRDLATARRFYVEGLGWEPRLDLDEVVFIQIGHGLLLALWPAKELDADIDPSGRASSTAATAPFALAHNVGSEHEVDEVIAHMVAAGGTVLKPGQRAAFGGYHGYVADPDGFRWEIAYNAGLVVEPDGRVRFLGAEQPEPILAATKTVLVVDWPTRDVPDALARAGFEVVVRGGPGPEDFSAYVLEGDNVVVHTLGHPPDHADLVYAYRPLDELPAAVEMARGLGAKAIWTDLADDESQTARQIVASAGLAYVNRPDIADVARRASRS
jgi:catechol 2,3-dioxygenase-like lactoylglutathione lyase family enzyme/predicted CoA-binding protein